ncbi:MAG: O-antigen ligase family protein [Saccharospirillum sp.]|nr:O-antigen ligase family protein [Saccharospirillum sp.]
MANKYLDLSLFFLVLIFCSGFFFLGSFQDVIIIFLGLLGIYAYFIGNYSRKVLLLFLSAAILLPILSWWSIYTDLNEAASTYPKPAVLTSIFVFLPIALAIRGESNRLSWILVSFIASLLLIPWSMGNGIEELRQGFAGRRVGFGIVNAQHSGMLLGAGILAMIVFFNRLVTAGGYIWPRFVVWLCTLSILLILFVFTQLRAGIMALVVVGPLLFFWSIRKQSNRVRFVVSICVALMFLIFLNLPATERLTSRFAVEFSSIQHLMEEDLDSIPANSIGIRFQLWKIGLEHFWDRPFLGWDRRGETYIIENRDGAPAHLSSYGHLHNSYLSLWITFGLLGIAFYAAFAYWIGSTATRLYFMKKALPEDVYVFSVLFFVYFLIMSFFEQYIFYDSGIYILSLVIGIVYSYHIKYEEQS